MENSISDKDGGIAKIKGAYMQMYEYIGLHVKYLLVSPDFNETSIFSIHCRKILKHFIRIRPVGPELSNAGRT
jgi:hypothetical protein